MKKIIYLCLGVLFSSQIGFAQYFGNQAASFNGTNSYIAYQNTADLNPTTSITIEAWVNPAVLGPSFQGIISKSTTAYVLGIQNNGRITFNPRAGAFFQSKFLSRLSVNQWTHVAATYDGSTTIIYINGVLDTATFGVSGTIAATNDSLYIGANTFAAGSPGGFFNGKLDNVRIWAAARNASQIAENRFVPLNILLPTGTYQFLRASFSMDGSVSSYSNTSLFGWDRNLSYVNYSNKAVNYLDYNNSLVLNGTTDYFRVRNNNAFNAVEGLTLETWIKRDTTGIQPAGDQYLICKNNGTRFNYKFWMDATGSLKFKINDPSGPSGFQTLGIVTGGQWTHVAVTYNSSTGGAAIYVNGVRSATATISGTPQIQNNPDSLFIGGLSTSGRFKGQMDEVRVWKIARTEDQIKGNMYRHLLQSESNCAYFTFDDHANQFYIGGGGIIGEYNGFAGSAYISSSHINFSNQRTSPMLSETDFYTPTYANSPRKYFIPDNNAVGITDSVYVSAGGTVTGLKAYVLMSHTNVSNITVTLTSPNGTSRILIGNKGGNGYDIMTIFSDAADSLPSLSTNINGPGITAPFSPSIKPEQPLSGFNGQSRQGWWKLKVVDNGAGNTGYLHAWGIQTSPTVGIEPVTGVPNSYELSQNYPNPFNPSTKIDFSIPENTFTSLKVYDILGKEVAVIINENLSPGRYSYNFNGFGLASGIYFYKLETPEFTSIKKMSLLK